MSYTLTAFELALGNWLTGCLPGYADKIIYADNRGVALPHPFLIVNIVDETPLNAIPGSKLTQEVPDDAAPGEFVESVSQTFRALVSLNFYGESAFEDARRFVLESRRFKRASEASALGFTVAFNNGIRRFAEETALENEQRVQTDLTIYYKRTLVTSNIAVAAINGQPE